MQVHTYNPSTQEAEAGAGGSPVGDQPELHSEILSHKTNRMPVNNQEYKCYFLTLTAVQALDSSEIKEIMLKHYILTPLKTSKVFLLIAHTL
jgi:hypothetical protein